MSDAGRQGFGDKMSSAAKPDSQKPYTQQAGETIKGYADSAASTMQPESQKSTTQKAGDHMSGNANQNQDTLLGKARNAMSGDSK